MKQTITQYLYMTHEYKADFTSKEWRPALWPYSGIENGERIYIGPLNVDVVIPDDFDPVPKQVAALEAEKLEALKAYQAKVGEINERLSKLQAICHTEPA